MGAKVKISTVGAVKVLKGSHVRDDLLARAERIAAKAGPGMKAGTFYGRGRVRASVITDTPEAMREEAANRTLTKALSAGQ